MSKKQRNSWCPGRDLNSHGSCDPQDFKSRTGFFGGRRFSPASRSGRGFRSFSAPGGDGSKMAGSGASVIPVSSGRG